MRRLKTQWPNSYGSERLALIWHRFKDTANHVFTALVTGALNSLRSPPLADDLSKLEQEYTRNEAQLRIQMRHDISFGRQIEELAKNNRTADPEFVQGCLKLLRDRQNGKLTEEQFLQGCDYFDQIANRRT